MSSSTRLCDGRARRGDVAEGSNSRNKKHRQMWHLPLVTFEMLLPDESLSVPACTGALTTSPIWANWCFNCNIAACSIVFQPATALLWYFGTLAHPVHTFSSPSCVFKACQDRLTWVTVDLIFSLRGATKHRSVTLQLNVSDLRWTVFSHLSFSCLKVAEHLWLIFHIRWGWGGLAQLSYLAGWVNACGKYAHCSFC